MKQRSHQPSRYFIFQPASYHLHSRHRLVSSQHPYITLTAIDCCRMHRTRADLVQKGKQKPSRVGCNGWSLIPGGWTT